MRALTVHFIKHIMRGRILIRAVTALLVKRRTPGQIPVWHSCKCLVVVVAGVVAVGGCCSAPCLNDTDEVCCPTQFGGLLLHCLLKR